MTSTAHSLGTKLNMRGRERPLRILHVAECYEAGVGHAVDTIVRILDRDTHILLYSGEKKPNGNFSETKRLRRGLVERISDVRSAVRQYNPDVLHLHSSWAGVYGRVARIRIPIVYQPHCYKFDDPSLPKLKKHAFQAAEKGLGGLADVVLALSAHESRLAMAVSPSATLLMMPNAPTVDRLDTSRPAAPHNAKKVVMVGRISSQKDPSFYIETAATIRRSLPDTEFLWAGDGDEGLRKALKSAGILVTGWLDSPSLVRLLDSASCYVHTANYEGFPLSILDAAARKLPIVAREIPAFEDTKLIQGEDAATVAQHVIDILSHEKAAKNAVLRGQQVLDEMNEEKQRQALQKAYTIAMGDA